ncbi:MAG: AAA family ATPase [Acidobacteriota bacterium]|nr:AAA family ATPase [Acidobacteriota bacterium]
MIKQFLRIQAPALFQDFSWPPGLDDFSRYNLIYGWNGAGKTSLVEIMRQIETGTQNPNSSFEVQLENQKINSSNEAALEQIPIKVFTKSFVEKNVFNPSGMPGIVFLGQENIADQKELEEISSLLREERKKLIQAENETKTANNAWAKHQQDTAKAIKDRLLGNPSYQHYKRNDYERRADELSSRPMSELVRTDDELKALAHTKNQQPRPDLHSVSIQDPNISSIEEAASEVLSRSITRQSMEALESNSDLRNWVDTGLQLHRAIQAEQCGFCGNHLEEERLKALEDYFAQGHRQLTEDIERQLEGIATSRETLVRHTLPTEGELYQDHLDSYRSASAKLKEQIEAYLERLEIIQACLEEKRANPFSTPAIPPAHTQLDLASSIASINAIILSHNQQTKSLQDRADSACKEIEEHHIAEAGDERSQLLKDLQACRENEKTSRKAIQKLEEKVKEIKSRVDPHSFSAEQLTKDLRRYLGRDELSFELFGKGYQIVRSGTSVATGLSEGERTAIALLYFLQSLHDQTFQVSEGIVVLDDPVSSLDSNALFNAFSFIRAKTVGAKQLFILTHNFTFFRLVRRWFLGDRKNSSLYSLKALLDSSGERKAVLQPLDYLLRTFESEYHYLFSIVHSAAQADSLHDQEICHLPNTARRLLEAFISFHRPTRRSSFERAIEELSHGEPVRATRIVRFTHAFSHNEDFESSADQDMSQLSEAQPVMADVMTLIKSVAPAHFKEMEALLRSAAQSHSDRSGGSQRLTGLA